MLFVYIDALLVRSSVYDTACLLISMYMYSTRGVWSVFRTYTVLWCIVNRSCTPCAVHVHAVQQTRVSLLYCTNIILPELHYINTMSNESRETHKHLLSLIGKCGRFAEGLLFLLGLNIASMVAINAVNILYASNITASKLTSLWSKTFNI